MSKEEAIKELSELEPKEAEAWAAVEEVILLKSKCNQELELLFQARIKALDDDRVKREVEWLPLHTRKQQLKTFIEMV